MTVHRIPILFCLVILYCGYALANSRLNCDFESDCCWQSPKHSWSSKPKADLPWFRRIFRGAGRRGVPAGPFISKSIVGKETTVNPWESCDFCSSTGVVNVEFRHWQSPTANIKLCWSAINETFQEQNCESVQSYKTDDPHSMDLYVPKNTPIKIGFVLVNRGARSQAVVVIDRIHVQTEFCSLNVRSLPTVVIHKQPKVVSTANMSLTSVQTTTTTVAPSPTTTFAPLTFPTLFPPLNLTIPPMFSISPQPLEDILKSMPRLPGFPAPTAKQTPAQKIVVHKRPQAASAIKAKATSKPSSDPFTDMFGKDFAEFLRPDFDSTKTDADEANTITGEDADSIPLTQLETKGDVCNTIGGCLFDNGMCGYRNSKTLSNKGTFIRGMSGKSIFIETRLEPGEVAVFETRTRMEEPHVILFDWLEFTEGEKLSACCYTPGRTPQDLVCPMESESHTTTEIAWKPGRIECPTNTTKIMFICENFGRGSGVCALDTIRLFKQSDVAMQYPCQHSVFAQKQL